MHTFGLRREEEISFLRKYYVIRYYSFDIPFIREVLLMRKDYLTDIKAIT